MLISCFLFRFSSSSQSCTVQIPVTWSTPPGPCPTRNSWWGQPFSTAATLASFCRGAPLSPATVESQAPQCGRLGYPTVFVSTRTVSVKQCMSSKFAFLTTTQTLGLHGSLVIHHPSGLVQPCEQDRQFHIVNCRLEALSLWICDLTWVGLCDFLFFIFCTKKKNNGPALFSLLTQITASQRAIADVSSTAFSSYDWRCVSVHVCFSRLLMFMQSVWYVNAMLMHHTNQPSATWRRGWRLSMSHVTSARACQICRSGCDAKPLTCVEKTHTGSSLIFFFLFFFFSVSSGGFCFLWKPWCPWQRLPDPV